MSEHLAQSQEKDYIFPNREVSCIAVGAGLPGYTCKPCLAYLKALTRICDLYGLAPTPARKWDTAWEGKGIASGESVTEQSTEQGASV